MEAKKLTAAVALFNNFSAISLVHFSTSSSYLGIFNLVTNTNVSYMLWEQSKILHSSSSIFIIHHLDQQSFYSLCCLTFLPIAWWLKELAPSTVHTSIPTNKMKWWLVQHISFQQQYSRIGMMRTDNFFSSWQPSICFIVLLCWFYWPNESTECASVW